MKIKSLINTSYMLFVFDFHDPTEVDKKSLLNDKICPLDQVFESQRMADHAKQVLKKDFKKLLSLYFNQFQTKSGLDMDKLKRETTDRKRTLERHIGRDKVRYLEFIIQLDKLLEPEIEPRRGLLFKGA